MYGLPSARDTMSPRELEGQGSLRGSRLLCPFSGACLSTEDIISMVDMHSMNVLMTASGHREGRDLKHQHLVLSLASKLDPLLAPLWPLPWSPQW